MSNRIHVARLWTVILLTVGLLAAPSGVEAATFTVNAADDTDDGRCDARHCSLREAVHSAVADPGAATIAFNIPGSPPHVISLRSGLSVMRSDLTIDGTSEPDYRGAPVIVLDGAAVPSSGLTIIGANTVVRGLSWTNFTTAINIGAAEGTIIESNYIGLEADGEPHGNDTGIRIDGSSITISNNVISANGTGIVVAYGSDEVIRGNLIGTNPAGDSARGNGTGVRLEENARRVLIGGEDDADRNVISGSTQYGVADLSGPAGDNVITNNRIGTNLRGRVALPNAVGIYRPIVGSSGGSLTIRDNLISGNQTGVWLGGVNHLVQDNFIGIDPLGAAAVPNTQVGIHIEGCLGCQVDRNVISGNPIGVELYSGAGLERDTVISHNRIGMDPGYRAVFPNGIGIDIEGGTGTIIEANSVGGNAVGIRLGGGQVTLRGNAIGTDYTGLPPALPNGIGIQIGLSTDEVHIGETGDAASNIIAYNTGDGILSEGGGPAFIQSNRIYNNGGHGIHLVGSRGEVGPEGVRLLISANSIYDNEGLGIRVDDPSLNGNVQPPELTSATGTSVSGSCESACLAEVFLAAADPSNHGEGKTYLGYYTSTDGHFTIRIDDLGSCPAYTATATDSQGNTSEFSLNKATCLRVPPLAATVLIVVAGVGGSAFTVIIRRRPLSLRTAPWLLIGGLLGGLLGVLLLRLPFVQIAWQQPAAPPAPGGLPAGLPAPVTTQPPQAPPLTITPSVTVTPSATIPSPTETPTPTVTTTPTQTLAPPQLTLLQNANCRFGPGSVYGVITSPPQGQILPIDGRNDEGTWWRVRIPNSQILCWIAASLGQPSGDIQAVPARPAPPTPTPTPTPTPVLGCWVIPQGQQLPICTVPCPPNAKPGGACTP